MANRLFNCLVFFIALSSFGQRVEISRGNIKNLTGINQYKVVFEYPKNLEVPNHVSGGEYQNLWVENRTNRYEPTFITTFNNFRLKRRHITVSRNYSKTKYTIVVKISAINPGYERLLWDQAARLEASIKIIENSTPKTILFASESFEIHGFTNGDVFEKITTAYKELGLRTAKFLCRKT
ncbi:hypothetical protein [Maribacter sp. HTCC2170]|uniref:hypothetical protein n=1 Tax=Maribacter sp. (strain HTCC2170 / KCCM 42371) TaxID=313603 RepID=UPI00006BD422|nr:hypothetical protein [Maribacter sp. HTCC2170]EAR02488.1 hypothetical protein FB2170_04355 [Maribacter sp. HTCC2170]